MTQEARQLLELPLPKRPTTKQVATLVEAAYAPTWWRERAQWQLGEAEPAGVPLGSGVIIPSAWEPGAYLPHLVVALLAGNRVLLPVTTNVQPLLHAAKAMHLPVHGIAQLRDELLSEPAVQFVTWWDESHAGFTRAAKLAELAPGQLAPRRVWGQFCSNGVAIIAGGANVSRAVSQLGQFLFGAPATGLLGIERIVAADSVYEHVTTALQQVAASYPPLALPAMERAAQYYALAPYEGTVLIGGTVTSTHATPTVVANVPQSASLACEVVRAPLVAVQRARTPGELLDLASGGLYGSVAAVFGGNAELANAVAQRHIAHTVFINEMRFPKPYEPLPSAKLSAVQRYPDGPELIRNYEYEVAFLSQQQ